MSDELDKKLKEMLDEEVINPIVEAEGVNPKDYFGIDSDEIINKTKQAFREAGYIHSPLVKLQFKRIESGELMTGQEFYDRFEKELPHHPNGEVDDDRGYLTTSEVFRAARRAAGLEP
jgi:hypothetical protein